MSTFAETLVSNSLLASGLALAALGLTRLRFDPRVCHLLWLAALLKLVVVPLVPIGCFHQSVADDVPAWNAPVIQIESASIPVNTDLEGERAVVRSAGPSKSALLIGIWGMGSLLLASYYIRRLRRTNRLLSQCSRHLPANEFLDLAQQVGLRECPRLWVTTARVSPFVWSCFGRPVIVVPAKLLREPEIDLAGVLVHEMAHIKRRDHWVRHLEWLLCSFLWWHPLLWLILPQLRQQEELCCDQYVLKLRPQHSREYARSLVSVTEFLGSRTAHRLAMHCSMSPKTLLRRRVETMLQGRILKNRNLLFAYLAVLLVLPIALTTAQDKEPKDVPLAPRAKESKATRAFITERLRLLPAPPTRTAKLPNGKLAKDVVLIEMTVYEMKAKQLNKIADFKANGHGQLKVSTTESWKQELSRIKKSLKTLSMPKLITRKGHAATLMVGGEVPYTTYDKKGEPQQAFRPIGYQAEVRPIRVKDGKLQLAVKQSHSTLVKGKSVPKLKGAAPSIATSEVQTAVEVDRESTLIMHMPHASDKTMCIVTALTAREITKDDLNKR